MNRNRKNMLAYICLAIAIIAIIPAGANYKKLHADVEFREDGSVRSVDGIHNLDYSMYDKNGNWKGAVWGKDLCEMYGTADVTGAAEKFAASKGWIWVPNEYTGSQEQINSYIATKEGVSSVSQPKNEVEATTDAKTTPPATDDKKKEPKYSHGIYPGITEEAIMAFDYFTHDGVQESCYIVVSSNTEKRTMPRYTISTTAANSEYGEVQFVTENEEIVYKFVFSKVKTDADFTMELTPVISEVDEGIKVDFEDEKLYNMDLGFEVDFFFQTGKPNTRFYVYTSEADGFHSYNTITTDADGFARLPYTVVQDYTFSEIDLEAAAEEARLKEQEEEKAEARKLEEETKKAAEEQSNATAEESVIKEEPVEPIVIEEKNNTSFILLGVVAVVLIGAGFITRKLIK